MCKGNDYIFIGIIYMCIYCIYFFFLVWIIYHDAHNTHTRVSIRTQQWKKRRRFLNINYFIPFITFWEYLWKMVFWPVLRRGRWIVTFTSRSSLPSGPAQGIWPTGSARYIQIFVCELAISSRGGWSLFGWIFLGQARF